MEYGSGTVDKTAGGKPVDAAAGDESVTSNRKSDFDFVARRSMLEEQSCQISSRSDLILRSVAFFEQRRPNKNKKNRL